MSFRLRLLNLVLRLTEKRFLARVEKPAEVRKRFERQAARVFRRVPGAKFQPDRLVYKNRAVPGIWVDCGTPDSRSIMLYFHGGAYIQGSPQSHAKLAASLARRIGARIFLPEYRLAPENPFPAAVEDALTAYLALLETGFHPSRIAIGGDSAGGGLAFSLLHHLCAENLPRPACLVAFSPWTDLTLSGGSLRRNERADPLLPAARLTEMRDMYLQGADPRDPRASPVFGDFEGAPPVLIQAGSTEILLDDAAGLAQRLRKVGTDVSLEVWPFAPHVWQLFQGWLPEADQALDKAAAFLSANLDQTTR